MRLFENISVLETFTVWVTNYTLFSSIQCQFQREATETNNKYIQAVCPKEKSNESPIFNILNFFILIYSLFQSFKTIHKQFYKVLIPKAANQCYVILYNSTDDV